MESFPDPTLWAIPFFVVTMVLEYIWGRKKGPEKSGVDYKRKDTIESLSLGTGSVIAGALTASAVVALSHWLYQFRLFEISYIWWAWIVVFILDDFAYYIFHRSAHRVRWFWAAHVTHHSSRHYNLSTALRQTWTGFFALSFIFRLPLFLIGFPPAMVFFVVGINLIYQYWIHTEAINRMPRWFEAVMNTPSHHRVHHATNPRYLDKNYAGVFIIWDRTFGTFEPETSVENIEYGIIKNHPNFSIIWSAFHEWVGIGRDLRHAPGIANKLNYLIKPPGWSHDGSRESSETIKARWMEEQEKINDRI